MGKKKVIEISTKPLEATTIGTYNEHKHGWIGSIILFAIFMLAIFFMPQISDLYSQITGKKTYIGSSINRTEEDNQREEEKKVEVYDINEDAKSSLDDITISNFSINNLTVNYTITNNGQTMNLEKANLFLELYDESETLIKRVMIEGDYVGGTSQNHNVLLSQVPSKYAFIKMGEDDYPFTLLDGNTEDGAVLTCTKERESVTYTFKDSKLIKIVNSNTIYNFDENYSAQLAKFKSIQSSYNGKTGIQVNIAYPGTNEVSFTCDIDYQTASSVENGVYYAKNTTVHKIMYQMDAKGYSCK